MVHAGAIKRICLPFALVLGLLLSSAAPVGANAAPNQFEEVFQVAQSKIGSPWVHYAKGPNKFDCVGFVWYAFNENGLTDKIGGYRGVKGYYKWFKARGMVSKTDPQLGDLIIWGNFQHLGIYIGDGMAISALVKPYGVKIHKVSGWLNVPFRYYLHTNLAV